MIFRLALLLVLALAGPASSQVRWGIFQDNGGGAAVVPTAFDAGSVVRSNGVGACLTFQAGSSCTNSSNSLSYTHTPVGTPTCAILFYQTNSPLVLSGAFYGGIAMTSAGTSVTIPSTGTVMGAFYLPSPPAGPQASSGITTTTTIGANFTAAHILTFTGTGTNCLLAASYITATTAAGSSVSNTVASESNDIVADFFSFDTGGTTTAGGGQTVQTCLASSCSPLSNQATSTSSGSASVGVSWSDGSQNWGDVALSVQHQ